MKRWVLIAIVFLVAGAVVNVAVAWGCAALLDVRPAIHALSPKVKLNGHADWIVRVCQRKAAQRIVWQQFPPYQREPMNGLRLGRVAEPPVVALPYWSRIDPAAKQRGTGAVVIEDARGWPCLTLSSASEWRFDPFPHLRCVGGDGYRLPAKDSGSWEGRWYYDHRIMPVSAIGPGFAVNTLFYAAVLWLLIYGPFALRRLIRRRRGLCPGCGYPVGESNVCTECGRALPGQSEAAT